MKRIFIFIVFALNLLSMITDYNEGTIKAQTLANEYGYECEEENGFTYISPIPCEAVEICRTQCLLCGDFMNCEDEWKHYCYTPDESDGKDTDDNEDNNDDYGLGGGGNTRKDGEPCWHGESTWDKIKREIEVEKSKNTPSYFHNITRTSFYNALWDMINHPSKIKQGNLGTCGAAVLCKLLVETHPYTFYSAAKSVFENGQYANWNLSLPEDMKNCTSADLNTWEISSAEAIMETAIINANNYLSDYSPFNDDGKKLASATWPQFLYEFTKEHITENVSTATLPGEQTLEHLNYDDFIIASVHNENNKISTGIPNHYVQLKGYNGTELNYWTWGETHTSYKKAEGIYWILIIRK